MTEKKFDFKEEMLPLMNEIGNHIPGGFFIYKAQEPEELIYANQWVFDIFGCKDEKEFRELTGFTFKGMLHPDDYEQVASSIDEQIAGNEDNNDYVEYRIIRKDGSIRWVDDYGHYTETSEYGGIYFVFISDITEKRETLQNDIATRNAVVEALSEAYHTVWMINDVETESFSLYSGDLAGDSIHFNPIRDALTKMKIPRQRNTISIRQSRKATENVFIRNSASLRSLRD